MPDTALDNNEDHSITDDDDMILDDDVTFTDLSDAITLYPTEEDDLTQIEYELPPHQRCASHTLNLVASTDVDKYLLSCSHSKSVYRSSFGKCSALWIKTSRSALASDKVFEKLKKKLLVPSPTRWNSYHDTVTRVVENPSETLNELYTSIGLQTFTEKELASLKEYLCCPWATVDRPEYPPRRGSLFLWHIATNTYYDSEKDES